MTEPTENMINDWNSHNDHADDAPNNEEEEVTFDLTNILDNEEPSRSFSSISTLCALCGNKLPGVVALTLIQTDDNKISSEDIPIVVGNCCSQNL